MEKILILDFGGQYNQLIARRVREQHVYCELHPHNMPLDEIRRFDVLMYYNDVLLCYGITVDELKESYKNKFEKNMNRW